VAVPGAALTFSPTATSAATAFDAASNTWLTTVPAHSSGNTFLSGVALPVPGGLPGGINPVNWQGTFEADTPGLSFNWQWAAAVYSPFSGDYTALNVKPVDDNQLSAYKNSDHAGTPESYRQFVLGGARGGGGSNFTGSYSATASVQPPFSPAPPTGSLSGFVYVESTRAGLANVAVTLRGTTTSGQSVTLTTTTAADGSYHFTGLADGTYSISEVPPPPYFDHYNQVGSLGGTTVNTGNLFSGITLSGGANGTDYDFGLLAGS
jgi:hypothetical protein